MDLLQGDADVLLVFLCLQPGRPPARLLAVLVLVEPVEQALILEVVVVDNMVKKLSTQPGCRGANRSVVAPRGTAATEQPR